MINTEKAFSDFLIQQIRKDELIIYYYGIKTSARKDDYSYVGYETNTDGLFGIHYNNIRNDYFFGTQNRKHESTLTCLTYAQVQTIPAYLQTILKNVARSRQKVKLKKASSEKDKSEDFVA